MSLNLLCRLAQCIAIQKMLDLERLSEVTKRCREFARIMDLDFDTKDSE